MAGMIPLDPLPNLIDQVYGRLLEAIIDRTLLPGQRITQNELAERLGVSRQPISHALIERLRKAYPSTIVGIKDSSGDFANMTAMVERLTGLLSAKKKAAARADALAQISMLVGAVVLSRSTKGSPISEEIMQAARSALLKE